MRVVIDSNTLVDHFVNPNRPSAFLLADSSTKWHSTEFVNAEILSGLRSEVLNGNVSLGKATTCIPLVLRLPIKRHSLQPLAQRAFQLHNNFSIYDACYVALAEYLDAPLLTRDEKLRRGIIQLCPHIQCI